MRWAWLAVALALSACGTPRGSAQAAGDGWKAVLEWSPARLRALQPARLVLRVVDGSGRPVQLEDLRAQADMPEMSHDPDPVQFRKTGQGTYEATHKFSMDGRWRIRVTASGPGGKLDASFELSVGGP